VLPYITEEVWSWAFAEETDHASIHRRAVARRRRLRDDPGAADGGSLRRRGRAARVDQQGQVEAGVSVGRGVRRDPLRANAATSAGSRRRGRRHGVGRVDGTISTPRRRSPTDVRGRRSELREAAEA
jgi:hypothetical protein